MPASKLGCLQRKVVRNDDDDYDDVYDEDEDVDDDNNNEKYDNNEHTQYQNIFLPMIIVLDIFIQCSNIDHIFLF
jgi:hypothetical protein